MKNIGIITLPLIDNYGAVMQNFALQQAIRKIGFNPITIDRHIKVPFFLFVLSTIKTVLLFFIPKRRRKFFSRMVMRNKAFEQFVNKSIQKTRPVCKCDDEIIYEYKLDAIVVGSDQVWRPKYNQNLDDSYLEFAKESLVKKIVYAASFGTDYWEYTPKQTKNYKELISKFSFISTREKSGVGLCKKYFDTNAQEVADPTLLLDINDYLNICKEIPIEKSKYIAAYILDMTQDKKESLERIAKEKKLLIRLFSAESNASLSIPEWIASFRDATYVVTDSFHGTVFSILFHKEFQCLFNKERGNSRFQSLLERYHSGTLDDFRKKSFDYLRNALTF